MSTHEEELYFAAVAALASEVEPQAFNEALNRWVRDEHFDMAAYLEERGALRRGARGRIAAKVAQITHPGKNPPSGTQPSASALLPEAFGPASTLSSETATVASPTHFLLNFGDVTEGAVPEVEGRYTNVREFAQGGMGRILLVRDEYLGREIALKELLLKAPGGSTSAKEGPKNESASTVARFLQEARITARLEHPAIVPVYELGYRAGGALYYTMKLVRGRPLDQAIQEAGTLKNRLKLLPHFIDLCQAIAYAHSRGVIHRDVKPHNVMVGAFAETVVIDWGLAKDSHGPDLSAPPGARHSGLEGGDDRSGSGTRHGDVLGTPAYMSPEQARGELGQVDERSDIYSLGAVLYELLTGKHPFADARGESALELVATTKPTSVRTLEPEVPPELLAICERAMHPAPERRFSSALNLAEEVERYQSGALVETYRYGVHEHMARFMRRHLNLGIAITVALFLLLGISLFYYVRLREREHDAQEARQSAEYATARTAEALRETTAARRASETAEGIARDNEARAQRALYRAHISLADSHIRDERFDQAYDLLAEAPPEYRAWEWGRLLYLCNRDYRSYPIPAAGVRAEAAYAPAFALNERTGTLTLQEADGSVVTFDTLSRLPKWLYFGRGENHFLQPLADPACRVDAILDDNILRINDADTGEILHELHAEYHWAWSAGFSGDGKRVAIRQGPDALAVFDVETGAALPTIVNTGLSAAAVSEDGRLLATLVDTAARGDSDQAGPLTVWEAETGEQRFTLPPAPATYFGFARERFYAAGKDGLVRLWEAGSGTPIATLHAHDGAVTALALSPGGDRIATGSIGGEITVWSIADGALLARAHALDDTVTALAFDNTGEWLAAGLNSGSVASLSAASLAVQFRREGHSNPVQVVQFYESADLLLSASYQCVKFWRLHDEEKEQVAISDPQAVQVGSDGMAALVTAQGEIAQFDVSMGVLQPVGRLPGMEQASAIIAPGQEHVLTSGPKGLKLWRARDQQVVAAWEDEWGYANAPAAFSSDGRYLAFLKMAEPMRAALVIAEAETGNVLREIDPLAAETGNVYFQAAVAFDHDGRLGLACGEVLILFDPETGRRTDTLTLPPLELSAANLLRFSSDNALIAVTGEGSLVHVLDHDGHTVRMRGHTAPVRAMAFDQSGTRLFTGSDDGTVKVWDTTTGDEVLNWSGFRGPVRVVAYDSLHDTLVTGDEHGLQLAQVFPCEEAAYPGDPALRFLERVEAYKSYDPRVAPAWGLEQARLAQAADAVLEAGIQVNAQPGNPIPAPLRAAWQANGITLGAFGEPPASGDGTRLGNWHRFLELAAHLSLMNKEEPGYALAATEFRAMVTANDARALSVMGDWIREGAMLPAVLEMGHKFTAKEGLFGRFSQVMGTAAMKAGDYDEAVRTLEKFYQADQTRPGTDLMRALLLRNAPGDIGRALEVGRLWIESLPHEHEDELLTLLRARVDDMPPDDQAWLRPYLDRKPQPWDALPWIHDLDTALAEAGRSGLPVYLEIGDEKALGTAHLRQEIYGNPAVQDRMREELVLCYLEAGTHPEAVKRLGVFQLPALFLLDHEGDVLTHAILYDWPTHFVQHVLPGAPRGKPTGWRVIGALAPDEGQDIAKHFAEGSEPDFAATYRGVDAAASWHAYAINPYITRVSLEPWLAIGQCARFFLYTRFDGPPGDARLRLLHTGIARVWLNGELLSEHGEREGLDQFEVIPCVIHEGPNTLAVMLDDVGPHVNLGAEFFDAQNTAQLDLASLPLPECPELKPAHLRARAASNDTQRIVDDDGNTTYVEVRKADILSEWRENHMKYLASANPRPIMREGQITGMTADNLSQIPLTQMLGLRDGDVIIQINEWTPGSGISIQEAAIKGEGLPRYTIKVMRDGKPHTIIIDVDYD